MTKSDYYEVLNIPKNASEDEIKSAYRRKAKEFHPDKDTGNETKFKECAEAYEVLSDPQKKQMYDQFGHNGLKNNGNSSSGFHSAEEFFRNFNPFGNFHVNMGGFGGFNNTNSKPRPTRGEDVYQKIDITLEEACSSVKKEIKYKKVCICENCKGTGLKEGAVKNTCVKCSGTGVTKTRVNRGPMIIEQVVPCVNCDGNGFKTNKEDNCIACNGNGFNEKEVILNIDIPAGVSSGQGLRMSNQGNNGLHGGPSGDLLVEINVLKHTIFDRENNDLYLQIPVTISSIVLQKEIEVPTIYGKNVIVKLNSENYNKDIPISLKDYGCPVLGKNEKGTLFVFPRIILPLNVQNTELFTEIEKIEKLNKNNNVFIYLEKNNGLYKESFKQ